MKGIVLAAGFGTRLRPLTNSLPKPLIQVGGRPSIYYNLLLLKKYGITDVIINLHHYGEKIVQEIGDGSHLGMRVTYSKEKEIMGTGGGIKKIASTQIHETFVVMNGDIVIEIDLDKLIACHYKQGGLATLVLREAEDPLKFGVIEVDEAGRVRNILNKITWKGEGRRQLMFTGLHVLEPRILSYIPLNRYYSITDAYIDMLRNKERLVGYITKEYWNDLGQIDRVRQVEHDMKEGKLQLSHLEN